MPAVATKANPVVPDVRWTMPVPKSLAVRWYFGDRSGQPCTAIVTRIYRDTLDVMIFPEGDMMPSPKLGCRHVDDPTLKGRTVPNPGGLFELTQLEQDINRLIRDTYVQSE